MYGRDVTVPERLLEAFGCERKVLLRCACMYVCMYVCGRDVAVPEGFLEVFACEGCMHAHMRTNKKKKTHTNLRHSCAAGFFACEGGMHAHVRTLSLSHTHTYAHTQISDMAVLQGL